MTIKCMHKTKRVTGVIKAELPATKNYPSQYGIYWDYGQGGHGLYYWNDRSDIQTI